MNKKQRLFVSSVQKEFTAERRALKDFVHGDPLLSRFFDVFLFEDIPAADHGADDVYLAEVDRCGVYVALLGNEYGYENAEGVSPTEREFARATEYRKTRLIFVKGNDDTVRHPKMRALIRNAGDQLVRRRFEDSRELVAALNASLVGHLESTGVIQNQPFEERPCSDATLQDISAEALADFVHKARHERQFPLPAQTPVADVLVHLNMLHDGRPTNAAVLLFATDPQRFIPAAEIRCMHFHGTEIQRPVPFYRIFKGNLFSQVEQAADFVLSVTNRAVGTRSASTQAPVTYEIPPDVIREAIVNAVAHRDYSAAGAAIQVSVFADRVEIWNPGALPPPLTPADLRKPHRSVARNPRLCDVLFQAHYIEKYGTGTLMMIDQCLRHSLPEPRFSQDGHEFMVTLWRDWLTPERLAGFGLNERQRRALEMLRSTGRITNTEYQTTFSVSKRTAHRDLAELIEKGLVEMVGSTGKGTYYVLAKGAAKGPSGPQGASKGPKGSTRK